jgi:hypothetical protein
MTKRSQPSAVLSDSTASSFLNFPHRSPGVHQVLSFAALAVYRWKPWYRNSLPEPDPY